MISTLNKLSMFAYIYRRKTRKIELFLWNVRKSSGYFTCLFYNCTYIFSAMSMKRIDIASRKYSATQFPCPSLRQLIARDRKLSAETENYQLIGQGNWVSLYVQQTCFPSFLAPYNTFDSRLYKSGWQPIIKELSCIADATREKTR